MARTREDAKQATLIAQIAALVLLAGAVGVFALAGILLGGVDPADQPEITPVSIPSQTESGDARTAEFDPIAIAARLAMLENAPKIETLDPGQGPDTPIPPEPTEYDGTQTLADRLEFLGAMRVGALRMALLKVDEGRQRVVREGSLIPGTDATLTSVTAEAIEASDGFGARTNVNLKPPTTRPSFSSVVGAETADYADPAQSDFRDRRNANRPGARPNGEAGSAAGVIEAQDPLERRRQALQSAVERGTITQEQADDMMQRALRNSRRQPNRED